MSFVFNPKCATARLTCVGKKRTTSRPLFCGRSDCEICGPLKAKSITERIKKQLAGEELFTTTIESGKRKAELQKIKRHAHKFLTIPQPDGKVVIVTTDKEAGEKIESSIHSFISDCVSNIPGGVRWRTNIKAVSKAKTDKDEQHTNDQSKEKDDFSAYIVSATKERESLYIRHANACATGNEDTEIIEERGVTKYHVRESVGISALDALVNDGTAVRRLSKKTTAYSTADKVINGVVSVLSQDIDFDHIRTVVKGEIENAKRE